MVGGLAVGRWRAEFLLSRRESQEPEVSILSLYTHLKIDIDDPHLLSFQVQSTSLRAAHPVILASPRLANQALQRTENVYTGRLPPSYTCHLRVKYDPPLDFPLAYRRVSNPPSRTPIEPRTCTRNEDTQQEAGWLGSYDHLTPSKLPPSKPCGTTETNVCLTSM